MNTRWNSLLPLAVASVMLSFWVSTLHREFAPVVVDTAQFESVYAPCGSVMNSDYQPNVRVDTLAVHRQCLY